MTPEEAARRLRGLALTVLDLRPFWPLATRLFREWMREQFGTEGAWGGRRWAPLSGPYAAWKAKHYPGRSILVLTGRMRSRATAPRVRAEPMALTLTIESDIAHYHQYGTRHMPPRPLVPSRLPQSAIRDLERAADTYMEEVIRRWGLE